MISSSTRSRTSKAEKYFILHAETLIMVAQTTVPKRICLAVNTAKCPQNGYNDGYN